MKLRAVLFVAFASSLFAAPITPNLTSRFGKVVDNGCIQYAPAKIPLGNIVDGVAYPHCVWTTHGTTNQYAAIGWLPIDTTPPVRAGFVAEASGLWCVSNNAVVPIITWRALPPRNLQLSKMRLKTNLRNLGAWDDIWAFISADADVLQDWNDSVVLDERNPVVQGAFRALRQMLSDEDIETLITNSVTEIEVRQ